MYVHTLCYDIGLCSVEVAGLYAFVFQGEHSWYKIGIP